MKRNVRHVGARHNEWIHVHRTAGSNDRFWWFFFKTTGAIVLFVIALRILEMVLPFLILGALGWFVLKLFSNN